MRIVLQRVKRAQVTVDNRIVGNIDKGVMLLVGVHHDDTKESADFLVQKCIDLRIFSDSDDKMNLSLKDVQGSALIVSQFTLYGDCSKGRRPSFINAAPPHLGNELYEYFVAQMRKQIDNVQTGIFGAMMDVELVNDGPVTMILEKP
jgi:D-tyrosyl-tRNA(Tyr) deacylase